MKASIVIPVYNEINTIDEILSRVHAVRINKEIIVVDDGSTDGTTEHLLGLQRNNHDLKVMFHERNQGKGAALRTGFQQVSGDVVIIQDADLEYDPKDYQNLLEVIIDGRADVVYGSRFLSGPHRVLFYWHYLGNRIITTISNIVTNLNLTDIETCYKVFRSHLLKDITIKSNRFGFDTEFTVKVAKLGVPIYEVAISYSGRTYSEGKKITWRDGIKALFSIFWFKFFS